MTRKWVYNSDLALVMIARESMQLGILHFKMQRWAFRSSPKSKYNSTGQIEQSPEEEVCNSYM